MKNASHRARFSCSGGSLPTPPHPPAKYENMSHLGCVFMSGYIPSTRTPPTCLFGYVGGVSRFSTPPSSQRQKHVPKWDVFLSLATFLPLNTTSGIWQPDTPTFAPLPNTTNLGILVFHLSTKAYWLSVSWFSNGAPNIDMCHFRCPLLFYYPHIPPRCILPYLASFPVVLPF